MLTDHRKEEETAMKTLLAGGTVVNVFTGELEHANVLLDGPVIAGVGD